MHGHCPHILKCQEATAADKSFLWGGKHLYVGRTSSEIQPGLDLSKQVSRRLPNRQTLFIV
jgi:hypothetical protein